MAGLKLEKRGLFLGQRRDQLGARLLMILTCVRLSKDYDTDFRFNWFPPGAEAPTLEHPQELFSGPFMKRHFVTTEELDKVQDRIEPIWKFLKDKTPEALERHLSSGGHVMLDEGFDIVAFPWENQDALRERFPGLMPQIAFAPFVAKRMAAIDKAMSGPGGSVAYHIRRGDILNSDPWMHKPWPSKMEPDELYSAHLRKENPDVALVFSDQAESIRRFQARNPVVKGVDEIVDLSGSTPAQRDFLELYAMSRADKIVAPPISAFSRAAALISGRARLRFVDVLDSAERDAAYEELLARMKGGVSNFVTPSEAAHLYAKLSARLPEQGREQEAWEIGQLLQDSGATNAFVPLLHAVNCIYMKRWNEANANIRKAVDDPKLWQESHVSANAIRSLILGARGRARRCHKTFLRAFWQKPFLPDILVIGTLMISRRRLRPNHPLPFSAGVVTAVRVPYMRANMLLVQNKLIRRRALDFSTLVVEWPYFVMDGKAERVVNSRESLRELHDKVMAADDPESQSERESYCALVQARMGDTEEALARHTPLFEADAGHVLKRKRQAEILGLCDQPVAAAQTIQPLIAQHENMPYWNYLYGKFLLQSGDREAARRAWEAASDLDNTTALIHSDLADLCLDLGDARAAAAALDRAAEIAPNQQKFVNRKRRYLKKAS